MIKLAILLISCLLFAEENLGDKIQSLSGLKPESYSFEISDFVKFFEKQLENKSFFCQREVSLSEKEKCQASLKELKINYINSIYIARKNYLLYLNNKRLQELEEEKQKTLKVIN